MKSVVVIDIPGLSPSLMKRTDRLPTIRLIQAEAAFAGVKPSFPSVLECAHATLTTGSPASEHGMIGSHFFDRQTMEVRSWNGSAKAVLGDRIWVQAKKAQLDFSCAALFLSNLHYANCDYYVTAAPALSLTGETISIPVSKPKDLYKSLAKTLGEFQHAWWWGPNVSFKASEWIAKAAVSVLEQFHPTITFACLPNLLYVLLRYGPSSPQTLLELGKVDGLVKTVYEACQKEGAEFVLMSGFGTNDVKDSVDLNLVLRRINMLDIREVSGKEYVDWGNSEAVAVVTHQIGHVYTHTEKGAITVKSLLKEVEGIDLVLGEQEKHDLKIDHPRSGDLIVVARKDRWLNYHWWLDDAKAPPFMKHTGWSGKAGIDPLELFVNKETRSVETHTDLIHGSCGRPAKEASEYGIVLVAKKKEKLKDPMPATELPAFLCKLAGVNLA